MLVYVGLGVLLVPVIVLLAEQYPSYEERLRRTATPPQLAPIPELTDLQSDVDRAVPEATGCVWQAVYVPEREPLTGIARVYDLRRDGEVAYRYLVLRHDIACGTCRDLLFGLLHETSSNLWKQILLYEPLEGKTGIVDAVDFLAQFRDRPVGGRLVVGDTVDGLTGATRSVEGVVRRVGQAAEWLSAHPVAYGIKPQRKEAQQ